MRKHWASGRMEGHPRPDQSVKWSGDQNPMKNPATRKSNLQKIVKSWIKRGRFSKGEIQIFDALGRIGVSFVAQHVVDGPRRNYILDFFLEETNTCIEYDGHSGHYTSKGIEKDFARDEYILKEYGIKTIRFHRDEAFIGAENLDNLLKNRMAEQCG